MTEPEQNLSRRNRKKKRNRANNILNILIAVVVVLIITVASTIFMSGGDDAPLKEKESALTTEQTPDEDKEDGGSDEEDEDKAEDESEDGGQEDFAIADEAEGEVDEQSGIITYMNPDDDVVVETLVDTSWEPIGTTQTGEHVSLYDGNSVDWEEKKQALAYATDLPLDSMEFWKIKNGGSPQHSIGVVSSADKSEKYRVYLEWVDGQGWKPVKMDVLKTLDFNY